MHTSMHPCLHAGVQTYTRGARTSQILAVVANIPMRPMKTEERLEIGFMSTACSEQTQHGCKRFPRVKACQRTKRELLKIPG